MFEIGDTLSPDRTFWFAPRSHAGVDDLSDLDFARLVKILVRARAARAAGVTVPLDKLLAGDPI